MSGQRKFFFVYMLVLIFSSITNESEILLKTNNLWCSFSDFHTCDLLQELERESETDMLLFDLIF